MQKIRLGLGGKAIAYYLPYFLYTNTLSLMLTKFQMFPYSSTFLLIFVYQKDI